MSGNRKSRLAHINGLNKEIEQLKADNARLEADARKHQEQLRKARSERSARLDATLAELVEVTYRKDFRLGYSLQVMFPDELRMMRIPYAAGMDYLAHVVCDRVRRDIETTRFQAIAIEAEQQQQERMRQRYAAQLEARDI